MAVLIDRLRRWFGGRAEPVAAADVDVEVADPDAVVTVPITDELDLHTFRPAETASVVDEYLHEARALGLRRVRIIHGKGKGVQREIVHGVLRRHAAVAHFALADQRSGSWGATLVDLHPPTA